MFILPLCFTCYLHVIREELSHSIHLIVFICYVSLFLNDKGIDYDNFFLTFWWLGKAPSFISASTKPSSSNVTTSPLSASFHFGEVTLWTSLIATDLCTVLVFAQYIPTWKASCKWKMTNYDLLTIEYTSARVKCSFKTSLRHVVLRTLLSSMLCYPLSVSVAMLSFYSYFYFSSHD